LKIVILCLVAYVINAQVVNEDIICEGRVFEPNCTSGNVNVVLAAYGKSDSVFCRPQPAGQPPGQIIWTSNCALDVTTTVRQACQDRPSCSMPVAGADPCNGNARYLRVRWSCFSGNVQLTNNHRNTNIWVSLTANRANPVALHNLVAGGTSLYVFLSPPANIRQVRWYLDDLDRVLTTENFAPWELIGGRPWDTVNSGVRNGVHRIGAAITFTDGQTGYVDSVFTINNPNAPARALEKDSSAFAVTNAPTQTVVVENHAVPWSLFGTTVAAIVALSVVIAIVDRKKKAKLERA